MDTIFMNSENSKIFNRRRFLLNLTNKVNLRRGEECYFVKS